LYGVYRWNKGNPGAILTIRDDQTYVYEITSDSVNISSITGKWEFNAVGSEILLKDFTFRHSNDRELPRGNWFSKVRVISSGEVRLIYSSEDGIFLSKEL
jgi:hypothetical protein